VIAKSDKGKKHLKAFVSQIMPELRNPVNTLQPLDYNPYERLGPVPPNDYSYWNRVDGYQGMEFNFNPGE